MSLIIHQNLPFLIIEHSNQYGYFRIHQLLMVQSDRMKSWFSQTLTSVVQSQLITFNLFHKALIQVWSLGW